MVAPPHSASEPVRDANGSLALTKAFDSPGNLWHGLVCMAKVPSNRIGAGDIQDLAVAVEQLTEETRLLRQSLDELRDDVVWAARQVLAAGYEVSGTPPPVPIDPLAPDTTIADVRSPSRRTAPAPELTETAGFGPYCCDRPNLQWNGNPDAPGIGCENCGYLVAEQGSVVMWRNESPDPSAAPRSKSKAPEWRQANLFT